MSKGENMVERCARAIYERIPNGGYVVQHHGTAAHSNDFRPDAWEDAPDRHEQCRDLARAVIEALMEPTPEMVLAGERAFTGSTYLGLHQGQLNGLLAAYSAMLRTILSQPNDEE